MGTKTSALGFQLGHLWCWPVSLVPDPASFSSAHPNTSPNPVCIPCARCYMPRPVNSGMGSMRMSQQVSGQARRTSVSSGACASWLVQPGPAGLVPFCFLAIPSMLSIYIKWGPMKLELPQGSMKEHGVGNSVEAAPRLRSLLPRMSSSPTRDPAGDLSWGCPCWPISQSGCKYPGCRPWSSC